MPITDSNSQSIGGVSIVFGRLCLCHSVIALGGQYTWNWSKVAVNRVLLNAARVVWSPVFFTHHRPHHVSRVRGPGNGSLFFRRIAYVIVYSWIMSDTTKAVAFGDRYKVQCCQTKLLFSGQRYRFVCPPGGQSGTTLQQPADSRRHRAANVESQIGDLGPV